MTCGDASNVFRFIVFRWKPFFGSIAPTPNLILQLVGSSNTFHSPYNHDNRDQFEVLLDRQFQTVLGESNNTINFLKTLKLAKTKPLQWNAGSTTSVSNGLYFLLASDSGVLPNPTATFYFRVNFTDA